ncbi:Late secretory pathway protein AVL9-like protein [Armadillidium vulgare]|nr:Late secretory pathway protein AVL9-like protein [Armadillidium vulgare]
MNDIISDSESDDELSERRSSNSSLTSVTSRGSIMSPPNSFQGTPIEPSQNFSSKISSLKGRLSGALNYWTGKEKISIAEKPSATTTPNPSPSEPGDDVPISPSSGMPLPFPLENQNDISQLVVNTEKYALLEPSDTGLPLQIYTKGNLLHPYLSLQYLEVLTSPSTRAFIVGASNTLFIHKKNLYEVLVQLEDGKIEVGDPELKRQLSLSIEDLRFAENLVRQVEAVSGSGGRSPGGSEESILSQAPDIFLEGVGWMGGEEWIRHQFKVYLLTMLRSSLCPDVSRENEVFNSSFISAWKETHNYRMWLAGGPYPSLLELTPGHPHAGHLSMNDMRIRLSHTIQGLDKGRRLNQTLASTGTAVVKTKEAVGGAITSAKGALSTLWTSFTAPAATSKEDGEDEPEEGIEALEEEHPEKMLNQGTIFSITNQTMTAITPQRLVTELLTLFICIIDPRI